MIKSLVMEMQNLETIKKLLAQHKRELRNKFKVKEIGIFGSCVKNEQKKNSDVDILVEFVKAPSFFTFVELENYLSDILGVKVDLVMRSALKPAIGEHILNEVLYI